MNQMSKQPLVPASTAGGTVPLVPMSAAAGDSGPSVGPSLLKPAKPVEVEPLTDVSVPLESIKPGLRFLYYFQTCFLLGKRFRDFILEMFVIFAGTVQPLNIYDKSGLKVVLHFGKDSPRPDVLVMVVSIMSTNESPVTKCTFQAAVPKVSNATQ